MRKTKQIVATSMEREKKDIVGHFWDIYSILYNFSEDVDKMKKIKVIVEDAVNNKSLEDVTRITLEVVKKSGS